MPTMSPYYLQSYSLLPDIIFINQSPMNIKNIHYVKALDAFAHHSRLTVRELMSWVGTSSVEVVNDLLKFLIKEGLVEEHKNKCLANIKGLKKYYERKR